MKKKLLLHSCCAPCTSGVVWQLIEDWDITLYFYNPNIDTLEEFNKRLDALHILIDELKKEYKYNLKLVVVDYDHTRFSELIKGRENEAEGGERCNICFAERLDKTSEYASINNFDAWATTLTVSPHKNHLTINQIGNNLAEKHNTTYLESNFKKNNGFLTSIQNSKKYNLYRQTYCGCNREL